MVIWLDSHAPSTKKNYLQACLLKCFSFRNCVNALWSNIIEVYQSKNSAESDSLIHCHFVNCWFLFCVLYSLCATGSVRLKINGWVNVSFCLPHKVHNLNMGTIHIKVSPSRC